MAKKHHNPRGPLLDMREFGEIIVKITAGRSVHELAPDVDWQFRLSLERALEIIGEAANRVPDDVQNQFPEIPWSAIIGMRNILAHGYDIIKPEKLWDTATISVPELLRYLDAAIKSQPPFEA